MSVFTVSMHLVAGWCFWSLAHNLGHRWWHDEMRHGKQTFYAHGEREHHRLYDADDLVLARVEDPLELFISFPAPLVALAATVFVAAYGWFLGWPGALPFAAGLYGALTLDHQLHKRFHSGAALPGLLGWFQRLHAVHHATHAKNYFFVSGLVWDLLFRTFVRDTDRKAQDLTHEAPLVTRP